MRVANAVPGHGEIPPFAVQLNALLLVCPTAVKVRAAEYLDARA